MVKREESLPAALAELSSTRERQGAVKVKVYEEKPQRRIGVDVHNPGVTAAYPTKRDPFVIRLYNGCFGIDRTKPVDRQCVFPFKYNGQVSQILRLFGQTFDNTY